MAGLYRGMRACLWSVISRSLLQAGAELEALLDLSPVDMAPLAGNPGLVRDEENRRWHEEGGSRKITALRIFERYVKAGKTSESLCQTSGLCKENESPQDFKVWKACHSKFFKIKLQVMQELHCIANVLHLAFTSWLVKLIVPLTTALRTI